MLVQRKSELKGLKDFVFVAELPAIYAFPLLAILLMMVVGPFGRYTNLLSTWPSHVVECPHIVPKRELKFALESFWEGKFSAADLEAVAKDLRSSADGICWFPVTPSHTMIRFWTPQSLLELCPPFMARLGVVTLGLMSTSLWPMVMPLTLLWKWPNGLTPTSKSCTLWSMNWCAFSNKFFFKLRDLFSSHCYSWWTWWSDTLWWHWYTYDCTHFP